MKYLFLILFSAIGIQCTVKNETAYFDHRFVVIDAKIFKIEEKSNMIVYHFKNTKLAGIFASEKKCDQSLKSWKKIKLNKSYKLILSPMIIANTRASAFDITINGDFIWSSDMKEKYYDNCNNVCGNKIYEIK
ncbi:MULTISPECIES: hypothetical protein [Chryseobacterium]|uniref:Uncharacterized protein n=1 Tax=Chryseobacterium gambrini TaxID=373672 RepID=A0AAJ1VL24_9FLAO|nr:MULTISPECIES: hypothetical protein [Chryseobacterium]MDN4013386.1 hypothetical protein [Chryseobacterium gambrini]MDN4031594.1 hypothetical protein [Chryseobacterium gambrini]QWA39480.1 hypothetical protein KKI44_04525 [Chryseobacterium sp. ZHDP1]